MPRNPFLVAVLFSVIFPCNGLLPADPSPKKASEKAIFKGMWDGTYRDNEGNRGSGTYQFYDKEDGQLKVTVSWKDKKTMKLQEMKLQGKRLGLDAVSLEGKHGDTTYRYMGRMEKDKLMLYYLSIDETTGKSGSGVSTLTRQKR
jgi:hypothetical protein